MDEMLMNVAENAVNEVTDVITDAVPDAVDTAVDTAKEFVPEVVYKYIETVKDASGPQMIGAAAIGAAATALVGVGIKVFKKLRAKKAEDKAASNLEKHIRERDDQLEQMIKKAGLARTDGDKADETVDAEVVEEEPK